MQPPPSPDSPSASHAYSRTTGRTGRLPLEQVVLLCGVAAALVLLAIPASLPLGAYYWDIAAYLDGSQRIGAGQVPHVDFGSPFGALTLLLFRAVVWVFPQAQPVLAAQYAILLVAAPLMALVLRDTRGRGPTAVALAAPFMLFALAPVNGTDLEPLIPGVDAFGIYNRQAGLLCYLLAVALLFCRSQRIMAWTGAVALAALLFIKITAFACALGLLGVAVAAGRISARAALMSLVGPVAAAAAMQGWGGLTSAYIGSMLDLSAYNSESVSVRIVAVVLMNLTILLPVAALGALLALIDVPRWLSALRAGAGGWRVRLEVLRSVVDSNLAWLTVMTVFGIAIEHQNSGSNQFIYLWPPLLRVLTGEATAPHGLRRAAVALALAAALPTLVATVQRSLRIGIVTFTYERLDEPGLDALGHVMVRPDQLREAIMRSSNLAGRRETYLALVTAGVDPWPPVESHPVAQAAYLISLADAVAGLKRYEEENAVRLGRIAALDYYDPFGRLLGRAPVRDLPIVHDPARTMSPQQVEETVRALAHADGILVPRCRISLQRHQIATRLARSLDGRKRIGLTSCWILFRR